MNRRIRRLLVLTPAIFAAAACASEGPKGPSGAVGATGPLVVTWVDASGAVANGVVTGLNTKLGAYDFAAYADESGNLWRIDLESAQILESFDSPIPTVRWTTNDCTGAPFLILGEAPLPRFTFRVAATTPSVAGQLFVRADSAVYSPMTESSYDSGAGCVDTNDTTINGVSLGSALGMNPPESPFVGPLHPEIARAP